MRFGDWWRSPGRPDESTLPSSRPPRASPGRLLVAAASAMAIVTQLGLATAWAGGPVDSEAFAAVATAVTPAVVAVTASGGARWLESEDDDWNDEVGPILPPTLTASRRTIGAGVIVDPSGIVLTSAHLLADEPEVEVVTADGVSHRVTIVGSDRSTDLAVLRIDNAAGLPHVKLGDSDAARAGQWVIAVGAPYGFAGTVTAGIISARTREIGLTRLDDFLQTDASLHPGSSGGPLVNLAGEVIGINTASLGGGQSIGFAVPSNVARKVYGDLVRWGRVMTGWLGIVSQPVTRPLATFFGLRESAGILVADVLPGGAAAAAGLRSGDVLLAADDRRLVSGRNLDRVLRQSAPDQRVRFTVWRRMQEESLEVVLGREPDPRAPRPASVRLRQLLGLDVGPITLDLGVLVAWVDRASPAGSAGVKAGDIVREVDQQVVRSVAGFEDRTARIDKGQWICLLLQRGQSTFLVAFQAGR
jgi:serine protease Do